MYRVDVYLRVRRAVMVEGRSVREASRVFGLHRDTVRKMLAYSVPPGYRRTSPPRRPKLEPFTGVIDAILEGDRKVPKKQRHTAKRIFERLRDEYGFTGQYTIVKDYVRERRRRGQEMFVPLSHPPGHAQCDFGEAMAVIGDRGCGAQGALLRAGPASQRRLFREGLSRGDHRGLSGRPRVRVCLPWRCAPERPVRQYQAGSGSELGDGRRRRTRAFTELQSHYLFEDRFGRPGKGKVEGMVGYVRRNFLVPVPRVESFEALNAHLEQKCLPLLERKTAALDQAAPLQGWDLPEEYPTLRRLLEARMGRRGKREFVQILRLLEHFSHQEVHHAVKDALRLGAISFDAVKHLLLCRIEGRPPRLDLDLYPYLPRVSVKTTRATDYMTLLSGRAA